MEKSIPPSLFRHARPANIIHKPPNEHALRNRVNRILSATAAQPYGHFSHTDPHRRITHLPTAGLLSPPDFGDLSNKPFIDRRQPDHLTFEVIIGSTQLGDLAFKTRLCLVAFDDFTSQVPGRVIRPAAILRWIHPLAISSAWLKEFTLLAIGQIFVTVAVLPSAAEPDTDNGLISRETAIMRV